MSLDVRLILLCAVSVILLALGYFLRRPRGLWGALCLAWMAAALPLLFFMGYEARQVLVFYLVSAVAGLAMQMGGGKE